MNIGIDMQFSKTGSSTRGIGRYTMNMIHSLNQQNQKHSFYFFYPEVLHGPEFFVNQLKQFIRENAIDLFHITAPFEYLFSLRLSKEWFGNVKLAVTLYDLIPLIFPYVYLNGMPTVKDNYYNVLQLINGCDVILAISEATKNDAIQHIGTLPQKIKVIYGGVDEKFKPNPSPERFQVFPKYRIFKPYIMFTGGNDFRKNIDRLIVAFCKANQFLQYKYNLVIVCQLSQQEIDRALNTARMAGGSTSDLIFTGFVPDEDLVYLYNCATLFVFPSLYEGLGLPVLEAMACGTPVLTSNNSSLGEIVGNAAYKVNPSQVDEIAKGIVYLITNQVLLDEYRKKGFEQVSHFNWQAVGSKVLAAYDQI